MPFIKLITILFVLLVLTHATFALLMVGGVHLLELQNNIPTQDLNKFSITKSLLMLTIGAIFETYVFQVITFYAFGCGKKAFSPIKYIFWSSILFGLAHIILIDSNPIIIVEILQIVMHFFAGIIYSTMYYIMKKKTNNTFISFISVAFIHLVYNACITSFVWITIPN